MSTRDPLYGTTNDPLAPTGEQGSTNEAERLDEDLLHDDAADTGSMAGKAQEAAGKAQEMGAQAQEKAHEMGETLHHKADAGMDAAASGLGQAASMLREQGAQQEGAVGTAAARTADTLESASSYLQGKDTAQILDDIEAFVRQRPVESVAIAAGIGFVLSRIVK